MTYRDLLLRLLELTSEQLSCTCTVTSGCDENGNAEFFAADSLIMSDDKIIESAGDVLDPQHPVILFLE